MFEHEFAHHARLGTGHRILTPVYRREHRGARAIIVHYRRERFDH